MVLKCPDLEGSSHWLTPTWFIIWSEVHDTLIVTITQAMDSMYGVLIAHTRPSNAVPAQYFAIEYYNNVLGGRLVSSQL